MTDDLEGFATVPPELPQVRILRLEPGDILVLQHERRLDDLVMNRIREDVRERLPGHPVLVLDDGLTLAALLRKDA